MHQSFKGLLEHARCYKELFGQVRRGDTVYVFTSMGETSLLAGKRERKELNVEIGIDRLMDGGLESDGIQGSNYDGNGYSSTGEEFSHVGERNEMA